MMPLKKKKIESEIGLISLGEYTVSLKKRYIDFGINLIEMFASIIKTPKNIWTKNEMVSR